MKKRKILISACLLGENVRYDGKNCLINKDSLDILSKNFELIPVCPELLGGMTIPRIPSEIKNDFVFNKDGENVTHYFEKGFEEIYKICLKHKPKFAVLKEKSPSCGVNKTYDGTFSGTLIEKSGFTTSRLKILIPVYSEEDIPSLIKELDM